MADWRLFYQRLDPAHREWASVLAHEWRQTGHLAELGEDDASLLLRARSALAERPVIARLVLDAEAMPVLEIPVRTWQALFGEDEAERLLAPLAAIEEAEIEQGRALWRLFRPAHLSGPAQKRLRDWLMDVGWRLRDAAPR